MGGVIWAYMGPPELQPPPARGSPGPQVPATHRPRVEGDPGEQLAAGPGGRHRHLARAHPAPAAHDQHQRGRASSPTNPFVRGKAPALVVDLTDYGYQYAGIRPLDADEHPHPHLPLRPAIPPDPPYQTHRGRLPAVAGHIWVPMDDENTMVYNWEYSADRGAARP